MSKGYVSYRELSEIVNASYAKTKDIRKTMRETGVSFSEVWEMVGMKDYFDFEEIGEDRRVPNSTPFVFLTDTFTGKFLCFCDLGRGHFLLQTVNFHRSKEISVHSSNASPYMGIDQILLYTLTILVTHTQRGHVSVVPLFRSKFPPLHCGLIVLRNT